MSLLKHSKHENPIMQRVFNKYFDCVWSMTILEVVGSEDLITVEQKYLDQHCGRDNCMNIIREAYGVPHWPKGKKRGPMPESVKEKLRLSNLGQKRSEETKRRISESKKGIVISEETIEKRRATRKTSGYIVSEDTRRKISECQKGRPKTQEHKDKIKNTLKGRTRSDEIKQKISIAQRGRKHTEESKQKMRESKIKRDLAKKNLQHDGHLSDFNEPFLNGTSVGARV